MNSTTVYLCWILWALVLGGSAAWWGQRARRTVLGIFIDSRSRFSLSRFQITVWTILVFSLFAGFFFARVVSGLGAEALAIKIPNELLILMGITVGSTATATAVKVGKDLRATQPGATLSLKPPSVPRFSQVILEEEGSATGDEVSVTKFQNFWITVVVLVAYIVLASEQISAAATAQELSSLPKFDMTLNYLVGISHAGYIAGKLPDRR